MVLPWGVVVYGATLSAVVAIVLVAVAVRPRRLVVIGGAGLVAAVGPAAWNAILNTVHAPEFHRRSDSGVPDQLAGHRQRCVHAGAGVTRAWPRALGCCPGATSLR